MQYYNNQIGLLVQVACTAMLSFKRVQTTITTTLRDMTKRRHQNSWNVGRQRTTQL